jgi:hypothetical protein
VRNFQRVRDTGAAVQMKEEISRFYDNNMKYLMYRDWSGFELFFIEILKCSSIPGLLQIGHRFETFLLTLYREVQKRSILQGQPPGEELTGEARPA